MVSKIGSPISDSTNKSSKKKYKKNAMEYVDFSAEFRKDPKFKTELCNTFQDTGFCAYGNKCRFAHGKEELFEKVINHPKYRKSDCITFHTNGFCFYGQRCHFRHHEMRELDHIDRSYYTLSLSIYSDDGKEENSRRLRVFQEVTGVYSYNNKKPAYISRINHTPNKPGKLSTITLSSKFSQTRKSSTSSYQSFHSRSPISPMSPDQSMLIPMNYELLVNRKLNFNQFNLSNFTNLNHMNRMPYFQ